MTAHLWSRREVVAALGGGMSVMGSLRIPQSGMVARPIPRSGEEIAAVGLGMWQTFDVGASERARGPLAEVLRRFVRLGGQVVDSSPMYGRSEAVVGDLAARLDVASSLFHATKVWTRGERAGVQQMEESMRRMRVRTMDLMQIHNLVDWRTHLRTLRAWKDEGRIRYIGITHYTVASHDDLERIIRDEPIDFVQVNLSVATRNAEDRLLPACGDLGVAVLINRPYEEGALFRAVRGQTLPGWAAEFGAESWGQFFLKYILGNPHVTCVIPATSDPEHLTDNMGAGRGGLPDAATRRRMVQFFERR